MAGPAIALKWHRAVINHLTADRPTNHTSVLAVAAILLKFADADGTNVYPALMTVAWESGIHHTTATAALDYLEESGFIVHVRNRSRGLREWKFQFSGHLKTESPDFGLDFGSDFGSSETTSLDLPRPP